MYYVQYTIVYQKRKVISSCPLLGLLWASKPSWRPLIQSIGVNEKKVCFLSVHEHWSSSNKHELCALSWWSDLLDGYETTWSCNCEATEAQERNLYFLCRRPKLCRKSIMGCPKLRRRRSGKTRKIFSGWSSLRTNPDWPLTRVNKSR